MGKVGNSGVTGSSLICLSVVVGALKRCLIVDADVGWV